MNLSIPNILAAVVTLLASGTASAQAYPTLPIKVVVPYAAGGGGDLVARVLSEPLGKALSQAIVVENRPGGAGNIGAAAVAKAAPDGYTVLLEIGALVSRWVTDPKTAQDPAELAPVSHVATAGGLFAVRASTPANTVQEFFRLVKTKPGQFSYASYGFGTNPHYYGEYFNRTQGLDMLHVPYKGNAQIVPALLTGDVSVCFCGYPELRGHVEAGKIKILAYGGDTRSPVLPKVPTLAESGVPLRMAGWFGVWVPKGTPAPVVDRLSAAVRTAMQDPQLRSKLLELNIVPTGSTPQQLAEEMQKEADLWRSLIRTVNLKKE